MPTPKTKKQRDSWRKLGMDFEDAAWPIGIKGKVIQYSFNRPVAELVRRARALRQADKKKGKRP